MVIENEMEIIIRSLGMRGPLKPTSKEVLCGLIYNKALMKSTAATNTSL